MLKIKQNKKLYSIHLNTTDVEEFKDIALKEDKSFAELVREAMKKYLRNKRKKNNEV